MKHINKLSFKNYNARAYHGVGYLFSWAKAPALYMTMSQEEEVHFLDLAFRAQIELRNVKVKVTLR